MSLPVAGDLNGVSNGTDSSESGLGDLPGEDLYTVLGTLPEWVFPASSVFLICVGIFGVSANGFVIVLFMKSSTVSATVHANCQVASGSK